MIKKVIDFIRLPKQEYQKPAMEILQAEMEQMVAVSVTKVQANGLDEALYLDHKEGNLWDDAL